MGKQILSFSMIKEDNPMNYVDYLKKVWSHPNAIKETWTKEDDKIILILELSTNGMSCNEDIIKELQDSLFWLIHWYQSTRGGHYIFKICVSMYGFKTVSEFCKVNNSYKQIIYQQPYKYDWIHISQNKKLIKLKEVINDSKRN